MAISFVGADVLAGASAAIPTYQAGDLLIVAGWRSGSFLADPSGWTLVVIATASNYYASAWSKVAASGSSSDVVTLTGASYIGVWVARGASGVGASSVAVASTTHPGLTMQQTNGTSWVMGMGFGTTVRPATPAGMTSRSAASLVRASDTDGGVDWWMPQSTTLGHHFSFELLALVQVTLADAIPTGETHYQPQWLYDGQILLRPDTILRVQFIGSSATWETSTAVPTHEEGDLLIAFASGDSIPSLPAGWTSLTTNGEYPSRVAYRLAPSSGTASGTWTGATGLTILVYRGATAGAAAIHYSTASGPQTLPALNLSGTPSWVAGIGHWLTSLDSSPSGLTQRHAYEWGGLWAAAWDTGGDVTSWSATQVGPTAAAWSWLAASIQLIPTAETLFAPTVKVATWRDWQDTPWWVGLVQSRVRTVGSRVELVDSTGATVADLPVAAASVELHGTQPEQWAGSVVIRDPDWLPQDPTDLLDPRAGLRARIWWRLLTGVDSGPEVPLATLVLGDPQVRDREGAWEMTLTGRDVLSLPKRGGYRGLILDLGGMTVTAALKLLFAQLAPTVPVRVADTTLTLPSGYQVGLSDRTPAQDWTDLADVAGWVVRSDRDGVIVAGPRVDRTTPRADWSEGDDATVIELDRDVATSDTVNRVIVRSTSTAGVWAVVEDDDPGSATWVGRYGPFERVIESDAVTTAEGALSMARMQYGRLRLPTESIQARVPVRPDLDYRDPVILRRDRSGVGGTYLVSGWTIRLGSSPSLMEVAMMPRDML